jgi:ribonuclease HII
MVGAAGMTINLFLKTLSVPNSTHRKISIPSRPTLELESAIRKATNISKIAGLDEAGRGAIAGPVVAAAVILPVTNPEIMNHLDKVNDSKQLSAKQRDALFDLITEYAVAFGVGVVSAEDIDRNGIIPSTINAMQQAVKQLKPDAQFLIIDGRIKLRGLLLPQQSFIRGDGRSLTIAAASILAKVSRDQIMISLDRQYSNYGFAQHKGYCTRKHVAALQDQGPSPVHRYSFAPLRKQLL